jgi:malonyl CoA-acyl carrier protein transacylase
MSDRKVALLMPGQGAFYSGVLRQSHDRYPEVREVFQDIDAVAVERFNMTVSDRIFQQVSADRKSAPQVPEALQLALFGVPLATFQVLKSLGLHPSVIMGHSFGEIPAMVCAGAFTVREGAEIVCHRIAALRELDGQGGYMAAIGTNPQRARKILDLVDAGPIAVAGENTDSQTVVSGTKESMDMLQQLSSALQVSFARLDSPYPFHSPILAGPAERFGAAMRNIKQKAMQTPVYSPILERYYVDTDVLTDCLAAHLTRPVKFAEAVRRVYSDGGRIFVECGGSRALGKFVKKNLEDDDVIIVACLDPSLGDDVSLTSAIHSLQAYGVLEGAEKVGLADLLLPGAGQEAFYAFWEARGTHIASYVRSEYDAYRARESTSTAAQTFTPSVEGAPPPAPASPTTVVETTPTNRADVFKSLTTLYATALEYPEEVFTEDVELEAELGVDSVKQAELLARVAEEYHLPGRPEDLRLSDYHTMGKVVDFVLMARAVGETAPASAS